MPVNLTPMEAALFADSAYQVQTQTNMRPAEASTGIAQGQFDVANGIRFTGTTGAGATTGFGYVAFGIGTRQGECLVAVRGTVTGHDWLTDAHMAGVQGFSGHAVHAGFQNVAKGILPQIKAALGSRSPTVMHFVGHSLGGATATLLCEALLSVGSPRLYTFGSPRPGLSSHAAYLSSKIGIDSIYRVYHDTDPVPMVPIFPFYHIPVSTRAYMLAGTGTIVAPGDHSLSTYMGSVGGASWGSLPTISHARFSFETADDVLGYAQSVAPGPKMMNVIVLRLIGQAMEMMMEELVRKLGTGLFVAATVMDYLAAAIANGIAAGLSMASAAVALLQSIMQFLGRALQAGQQLTTVFIQWVLGMLFNVIAMLARQAVPLL